MALFGKKFLAASLLALIVSVAACDSTATPTTETAGSAPVIASLTPSSPQSSTAPQALALVGENFRTGLTVTLASPDGVSNTYSGQTVMVLSSTSLTLSATVPTEGMWTASVKNLDGLQSVAFQFRVSAANGPAAAPVITAVSPNPMTASTNAQSVAIAGTDFRAGATVTVTNGAGTNVPVTITGQDATLLNVAITVVSAGTYSVQVRNADGTTSAPFSLTVNAAPAGQADAGAPADR